jgi:hypothetical protein
VSSLQTFAKDNGSSRVRLRRCARIEQQAVILFRRHYSNSKAAVIRQFAQRNFEVRLWSVGAVNAKKLVAGDSRPQQ